MNRADRRAARRTLGTGHQECGCTPRLLTPVELWRVHDGCGETVRLQTCVLPTAATVGSVKTLHVACSCGEEVEALYLVGQL